MPRLIWVFAERTLILLVLSCRGSFVGFMAYLLLWSKFCTFLRMTPGQVNNWRTFDMSAQGGGQSFAQRLSERGTYAAVWNFSDTASFFHCLSFLFFGYERASHVFASNLSSEGIRFTLPVASLEHLFPWHMSSFDWSMTEWNKNYFITAACHWF